MYLLFMKGSNLWFQRNNESYDLAGFLSCELTSLQPGLTNGYKRFPLPCSCVIFHRGNRESLNGQALKGLEL